MPPPPVDRLPLSVPVFHILLSLADGDLHGYGIIQATEQRTAGEVRLTASTLYGAVARMLEAQLIEERAPEAGLARRRNYRLTRAGRLLLRAEAERLQRTVGWARGKGVLSRKPS